MGVRSRNEVRLIQLWGGAVGTAPREKNDIFLNEAKRGVHLLRGWIVADFLVFSIVEWQNWGKNNKVEGKLLSYAIAWQGKIR